MSIILPQFLLSVLVAYKWMNKVTKLSCTVTEPELILMQQVIPVKKPLQNKHVSFTKVTDMIEEYIKEGHGVDGE